MRKHRQGKQSKQKVNEGFVSWIQPSIFIILIAILFIQLQNTTNFIQRMKTEYQSLKYMIFMDSSKPMPYTHQLENQKIAHSDMFQLVLVNYTTFLNEGDTSPKDYYNRRMLQPFSLQLLLNRQQTLPTNTLLVSVPTDETFTISHAFTTPIGNFLLKEKLPLIDSMSIFLMFERYRVQVLRANNSYADFIKSYSMETPELETLTQDDYNHWHHIVKPFMQMHPTHFPRGFHNIKLFAWARYVLRTFGQTHDNNFFIIPYYHAFTQTMPHLANVHCGYSNAYSRFECRTWLKELSNSSEIKINMQHEYSNDELYKLFNTVLEENYASYISISPLINTTMKEIFYKVPFSEYQLLVHLVEKHKVFHQYPKNGVPRLVFKILRIFQNIIIGLQKESNSPSADLITVSTKYSDNVLSWEVELAVMNTLIRFFKNQLERIPKVFKDISIDKPIQKSSQPTQDIIDILYYQQREETLRLHLKSLQRAQQLLIQLARYDIAITPKTLSLLKRQYEFIFGLQTLDKYEGDYLMEHQENYRYLVYLLTIHLANKGNFNNIRPLYRRFKRDYKANKPLPPHIQELINYNQNTLIPRIIEFGDASIAEMIFDMGFKIDADMTINLILNYVCNNQGLGDSSSPYSHQMTSNYLNPYIINVLLGVDFDEISKGRFISRCTNEAKRTKNQAALRALNRSFGSATLSL